MATCEACASETHGKCTAEKNQTVHDFASAAREAFHTPDPEIDRDGLTTTQQCILHYGSVHCAENIADVSEATRQRIKQAIMEDIEFRMRGFRVPYALETKLFDNFAHLNRDWRRIALTEVSEIENQGLIASLEPGRKVKRVGKDCACEFCQSIDGKIMEVVAADDPDKDGERHVWAGKTNIGRSACHYRKCREVRTGAARKMVGCYRCPASKLPRNMDCSRSAKAFRRPRIFQMDGRISWTSIGKRRRATDERII